MTDASAAIVALGGYACPRQLPTGEWAALHRFLFTTGLVVGITPDAYRTRYCYQSIGAALQALMDWNGEGDPPGDWIKEKGYGRDGRYVDRANPALCVHQFRDGDGICIDCFTRPA